MGASHTQDIGDGWWEGKIGDSIGLFPESYVELADAAAAADSDDWDEEGDEEWDENAGHGAAPPQAASHESHDSAHDHMESSSDYAAPAGHGAGAGGTIGRGTLRKSVNRLQCCFCLIARFSGFVKAGAESYMIGGLKDITIDPTKMIHLQVRIPCGSDRPDDRGGSCLGAKP